MKPQVLLRTASFLTLVHALLHTFGGLLSGTSHNHDEVALLNAMKSLRFDAMGSLRTYWDFYFGFCLFLTVSLLLLSALLWQLAALIQIEPAKARPFIAPLFVEGTVALLLGFAYAASRKPA